MHNFLFVLLTFILHHSIYSSSDLIVVGGTFLGRPSRHFGDESAPVLAQYYEIIKHVLYRDNICLQHSILFLYQKRTNVGGGRPANGHIRISNILRAQHRETHIFCCDGPHNAAIVCLCPALYLCCAVPGTIPIVCVCVCGLCLLHFLIIQQIQ